MIWNIFLHIGLGYFGKNMITGNNGLLYLLGLTIFVQAIDMLRFHTVIKENARSNSEIEHIKTNTYKYKLIQVFVFSVLFYGGISYLTAKYIF